MDMINVNVPPESILINRDDAATECGEDLDLRSVYLQDSRLAAVGLSTFVVDFRIGEVDKTSGQSGFLKCPASCGPGNGREVRPRIMDVVV